MVTCDGSAGVRPVPGTAPGIGSPRGHVAAVPASLPVSVAPFPEGRAARTRQVS